MGGGLQVMHLHNAMGVAEIKVASKRFMCMGALPPMDHPHVFIEMGAENTATCPYCATIFRYDANLKTGAIPAEAVLDTVHPHSFEVQQ